MKKIALLIAGGRGSRINSDVPKQFMKINSKPLVIYTLEAFEKHDDIDYIAVSCLEGWNQVLKDFAKQYNISKLKFVVPGGQVGQESIRNGIFELEKHFDKDDLVLIHDANRPLVSSAVISDNIRVALKYGNAIAAIPCADAMLKSTNGVSSIEAYPRELFKRTQTPHAFRLGDICRLHRKAEENNITNSVASCTLKVELGEPIYFSNGSESNIKLTTEDDLEIITAMLDVRRRKAQDN